MATVNEKMTAIADNIRKITGTTEALTLDDMANGINEVYNAGKETQYNNFWDIYQNHGKRKVYQYVGHLNRGFPPEVYDPKYDLQGDLYLGFTQSKIEDIKVRILNATDISQLLRYSNVRCVPELNISENTVFGTTSPFFGAKSLVDITITGVLAKSLSFADSPLSKESVKGIVKVLKDYSGTDDEYNYTITFKATAFNVLEEEGATAEYNGKECTWAELIDNKKWNLVKA